MGKNKLAKFADLNSFSHVFYFPYARLMSDGFPLKGKWNNEFFKNDHPIVLELGCGKGEYTVGLAKQFPEKNFIGIDIKGSRMWTGAKAVDLQKITNSAFVRTNIELISHFFGPGEVSEIWITFPDPQMKIAKKRLNSTTFLKKYFNLLMPEGVIHLKTDSNFLYQYTKAQIAENHFRVEVDTDNLYASGLADDILGIKTYYEQQWLDRGKTIKYIRYIPHNINLVEPDIEIEFDDYRSFGRSNVNRDDPQTRKSKVRPLKE